MPDPRGYLAMVLHAHLPYVRHPEYENFLEERWLFEALTETYLPLLRVLERLEDDGVDYALLISLSPTLLSMFGDDLLRERYTRHLGRLISFCDGEVQGASHRGDGAQTEQLRFYADRLRDTRYWYDEVYGRDMAAAFQRIAHRGRLELMTCVGTHPFLPLFRQEPTTIRAQIRAGLDLFETTFGVRSEGLWLPECAWFAGVDRYLAEADVRYVFGDAAALDRADAKAIHGLHAPVLTPSEVALFARDSQTSNQVWSAHEGYPGHPDYREYYRDAGYEWPLETLGELLAPGPEGPIRGPIGVKLHRITGSGDHKEPYDPEVARGRAADHAGDFVFKRQEQIGRLARALDRPPLITSPYDAELFGHWWFEGPWFLDYVFRKLCYDQTVLEPITPGTYLERHGAGLQVLEPGESSWGMDSNFDYWLNPSNDALLRDLHEAGRRMAEYAARAREGDARDRRILAQMGRELMLAQASDWPFIMRSGTSPEYAAGRVRAHLARFETLAGMLESGRVEPETLAALEYADALFPDLDPAAFAPMAEEV